MREDDSGQVTRLPGPSRCRRLVVRRDRTTARAWLEREMKRAEGS